MDSSPKASWMDGSSGTPLPSIDRASVECGLVEALAEVESFEHELEHRDAHRVRVRFTEALACTLDPTELGERLRGGGGSRAGRGCRGHRR